jgi:hypothetical protein
MRGGYVPHSRECIECGVAGKCCSNVLHSFRAYGVSPNADAHVCMRRATQRTCVAHDARSHTYNLLQVIYTYAYVHANIPNTNTCACLARTYHAQTCPTTIHSCEQAMHCTHWSVWSVKLWASAAAMCCAPSAPIELYPRLYAHVCVRRRIQRTCVAHDARSHTNTECEVIYTHTYVHADIPNTNTCVCLARIRNFIPVQYIPCINVRTHASRLCIALT